MLCLKNNLCTKLTKYYVCTNGVPSNCLSIHTNIRLNRISQIYTFVQTVSLYCRMDKPVWLMAALLSPHGLQMNLFHYLPTLIVYVCYSWWRILMTSSTLDCVIVHNPTHTIHYVKDYQSLMEINACYILEQTSIANHTILHLIFFVLCFFRLF